MAILVIVIICDSSKILLHMFFLLFQLIELQNFNSYDRVEVFLRFLVSDLVMVIVILFFFLFSLIDLIYLRLKRDWPYFSNLRHKFFIFKIFWGPRPSFFELKLIFSKVILIGILGTHTRPKSHFSFNILYFFD